MNKILLLIGSAMLVACGTDAPTGTSGPPAGMQCDPYPAGDCTSDDPNNPIVQVNLDDRTIDPECVQVFRNRPIMFMLESSDPIVKDTVGTFPKEEQDDWLSKSNDPNKNKIQIHVPDENKEGDSFPTGEYRYGIYTPEWCYDPRVEVIPLDAQIQQAQ